MDKLLRTVCCIFVDSPLIRYPALGGYHEDTHVDSFFCLKENNMGWYGHPYEVLVLEKEKEVLS